MTEIKRNDKRKCVVVFFMTYTKHRELRMLFTVTLYCQVTKIVMNPFGPRTSLLWTKVALIRILLRKLVLLAINAVLIMSFIITLPLR